MEGQAQGARTAVAEKRELGYTPGAKVQNEHGEKPSKKRKGMSWQAQVLLVAKKKRTQEALAALAGVIPDILLEHAVEALVKGRAPLSVILLSMVNRQFHQYLGNDIRTWYRLYLSWRGPAQPTQPGPIRTARGLVTLHPTIPRSLPNFRNLNPSLS